MCVCGGGGGGCACVHACVRVCVCVCVQERESVYRVHVLNLHGNMSSLMVTVYSTVSKVVNPLTACLK